MGKTSTRFRTRKINFKSAISIYVGSFDNPFDDEFDPSPGFSGTGFNGIGGASGSNGLSNGSGKGKNGETIRVETGVDKEEEGEHHLQAVISASAAALQRSAGRGGPGGSGGPAAKAAIAHIPTPDATGVVANYTDFYQHNAYTDPHSYIRFSDTVEETMGIAYTMDEDDEDFLIDHNLRAAKLAKINGSTSVDINGSSSQPSSPVIAAATNGNHDDHPSPICTSMVALNGHYPPLTQIDGRKPIRPSRKAKEAFSSVHPVISEDDFELVMDLFERTTDRKTPTLHLDISRTPTLEDLESSFSTYLPSYCLRAAKIIARAIYAHWRERRNRAGGKNIVPQLDYDETNETPYVCFRRREVKVARKTRRTDTQTLERLVRLKSDLSSAQELVVKVLERERCKREAILAEAKIFDSRVRMRDLKRKLGENTGDEAILIARREKKRNRDEFQQGQLGTTKIVIPNRTGLAPLTPGLLPDPLPPYKDRTANATQRVDKDMQRKREQELGWEDITDTAFLPLPQAISARYWRTSERHTLPMQDGRKPTQLVTFDHTNLPFIQNVGSRYRKRVGRGGRVHLDRITPRKAIPPTNEFDQNQEIDEDLLARLQERWRYDSDILEELPASRHALVLDDFSTPYASARTTLMAASDWESLYPSMAHIDEAMRWAAKEPDRLPPIQVLGKLPGQRVNGYPVMNGQMANGAATTQLANQMYAAANRALNVAQAQAQQIRRASSGGPQSPQQAQMVGSSNPPQPPQIRRIMWENATS